MNESGIQCWLTLKISKFIKGKQKSKFGFGPNMTPGIQIRTSSVVKSDNVKFKATHSWWTVSCTLAIFKNFPFFCIAIFWRNLVKHFIVTWLMYMLLTLYKTVYAFGVLISHRAISTVIWASEASKVVKCSFFTCTILPLSRCIQLFDLSATVKPLVYRYTSIM